jgi:Ca2+-binding EF-hand superfamily protein
MQQTDRDADGRISYNEFRAMMQQKLQNEMQTPEDVIDELMREFHKAKDVQRIFHIFGFNPLIYIS